VLDAIIGKHKQTATRRQRLQSGAIAHRHVDDALVIGTQDGVGIFAGVIDIQCHEYSF